MRPFITLAILLVLMVSCQQEPEIRIAEPAYQIPDSVNFELAFPNQKGRIEKGYLGDQSIEYVSVANKMVFEGDILLAEDQQTPDARNGRVDGTGRRFRSVRWTNNIVPYEFEEGLPAANKQIARNAMAHLQEKTFIKFVPRTTQTNYIRFIDGAGCWSYVGMIGGAQDLSVGYGCSTGNTVHEIAHALGVWHEQSRADRDKYIKIWFENVEEWNVHNFNTYTQNGSDGFDHGTFDFGSIMMYPWWAFSKNDKPTITKKDGSVYEIQRKALSRGDIAVINHMYATKITFSSILKTYDDLIKTGSIKGVGNSTSRVTAFRSRLSDIKKAADANNKAAMCRLITEAQKTIYVSGKVNSTHLITGPKAKQLNDSINAFKKQIGC
jgi:hypothetical protein